MRLLERQLLAAVHLSRPSLDIAPRPDAALLPGRLVVEGEDRRVEIGERVEIDEAGADDRLAIVAPHRHFPREAMADEDDRAILEHDLAALV